MTTDEVVALRKELEDALMSAFADFKSRTGMSVIGVQVDAVGTWTMADPNPTYHVSGVRVVLESL